MNFKLIRVKILAILIKIFAFLLAVELPPIPSVAAIIVDKGKILVVKLTYRNGYSLPGGVVEAGETLETALKREVKEETGLDIVEARYFGSFVAGIEMPGINTTFLVKAKGRIISSDEGMVSWEYPEKIISKIIYKDCAEAIKKYFDIK